MIRINGIDKESTIHDMSTESYGTYHLADNPNLFEIQRSNNFQFIITDIDGIMRAGMNGTEATATIPNAQEIMRLSVVSCPIPHFTQSPISLRRGNNEMKFAGVPTFGSGSLVVNDFIGADTKSVLMAWQNLSYDVNTEKVGLVSDYKKNCYLIELTPDNQKVRQWILEGCWVSGISEGDYNNEDNSKKTITATIEYDKGRLDTSEVI